MCENIQYEYFKELYKSKATIERGSPMASDRGQNRYSDFVALETLLRFENCSSSHCLLSSSRRIPRFNFRSEEVFPRPRNLSIDFVPNRTP